MESTRRTRSFVLFSLLVLLPALALPPLRAQGRRGKKKEDLFTSWVKEEVPKHLVFPADLGGRVPGERLAKEILPRLEKIAGGGNRALAAEALLTWAALDPLGSLPKVVQGMDQERDGGLRKAALLAAGLSGKAGAAGPLAAWIDPVKKDGPEKLLAALSLGFLEGGQGKSPLLQTFQRMLSRSQQTHAQTILAFLAGLSFCGTPGDATPLVFNLEQDKFADPLIRGAAAWLAARLDYPTAGPILSRLLRRKRDEARPYYLAALAYAPPKEKAGWKELSRAAAYRRGRPAGPALLALEALARRGGKEARKRLARLAARAKGPWAHLVTVARARAGTADKTFLEGITRDLIRAEDPERRAACALALGFQALPASAPALNQALKQEKDPFVQGTLALAMGLAKVKAAAPNLEALFLKATDPFPVRAAAWALAAAGIRRDPPASFWEEGRKDPGPAWSRRVQWLGWFCGEGSLGGYKSLLDRAPQAPEAVTAALRGLRIFASARKDPPAARLCLPPSFPMPIQAFREARAMLWGGK